MPPTAAPPSRARSPTGGAETPVRVLYRPAMNGFVSKLAAAPARKAAREAEDARVRASVEKTWSERLRDLERG